MYVSLINLFKFYVLCNHDPDFAPKLCTHEDALRDEIQIVLTQNKEFK